MDSELKLWLENKFRSVENCITRINDKLGTFEAATNQRFANVDAQLATINQSIDQRFAAVAEQLENVNNRVTRIDQHVSLLRSCGCPDNPAARCQQPEPGGSDSALSETTVYYSAHS